MGGLYNSTRQPERSGKGHAEVFRLWGLRTGWVTLRCHSQSATILCSVRGVELAVEMGHTMRLNLGILQSFPGLVQTQPFIPSFRVRIARETDVWLNLVFRLKKWKISVLVYPFWYLGYAYTKWFGLLIKKSNVIGQLKFYLLNLAILFEFLFLSPYPFLATG